MLPSTSGRDEGFNPDDDVADEYNTFTGIARRIGGADKKLLSEFENFDWTFGLKDELPGLKYLVTFEGPIEFYRGFINGTQMLKNDNTRMCDDIIANEVAPTMTKFKNVTETLFGMEDFYEIMYVLFDEALLMTRLL